MRGGDNIARKKDLSFETQQMDFKYLKIQREFVYTCQLGINNVKIFLSSSLI